MKSAGSALIAIIIGLLEQNVKIQNVLPNTNFARKGNYENY